MHYTRDSFTIVKMPALPSFLDLPPRAQKPRSIGLTHALDKGMPLSELEASLNAMQEYVDLWKFGWGTAYLDPDIASKVRLLQQRGITPCTGGTLLEVAWRQGRAERFFEWASGLGFDCVEVSNGATAMSPAQKRGLIEEASRQFTVVAEVGSKDPSIQLCSARWADEMEADLTAGARWVIAEGRESGSVGLYAPDGTVREDVVSDVTARVGAEAVIFEAPRKDQQAWFIRRLGTNVNLGNVLPSEIMGVEALRLGLRADTIDVCHPVASLAGEMP